MYMYTCVYMQYSEKLRLGLVFGDLVDEKNHLFASFNVHQSLGLV